VKAFARMLVAALGSLLLLAAVVLVWLLVRPLGWVYALAAGGALASALFGAGVAARSSRLGRWLMEDAE